ncbi:hypothetical protein [Frankia sp. QA3]|uniref:hypothetical protein n=1 Tax=Frankia sp. QA3 TaxID=710111 RepID=UPI001E4D656B|nr:hypothetical protein [Frankia sp. QA3]
MARLYDSYTDEIVDLSQWARVSSQAEKESMLRFRRGARFLLRTTALATDPLDLSKGEVMPMSYRSDGAWIWSDGVAYYLDVYEIAPEPEFVEHIRSRGYEPHDATDEELDVAYEVLEALRHS